MNTKHTATPGPWDIVRELDFDGPSDTAFVEQIGPFHIEWHDDLNNGNPGRIEADIALVSAAPDLLKALTWAVDNPDDNAYWIAQARAALAKAGAA